MSHARRQLENKIHHLAAAEKGLGCGHPFTGLVARMERSEIRGKSRPLHCRSRITRPKAVAPSGQHHYITMERPPSDRKSTRLNSSHQIISYAIFCLKKTTTRSARIPSRA